MRKMLRNFLWFCATSNKDLLEKCPTEHNKHALIGTLVLLTAIFAFISGSFAMNYMFEMNANGHWYALGFGLLWAFLIFSLDRLLISTIRKDTGMPGKNFSKNRQWALLILRFALAIVISVVITKPLELWLYEDQINAQIVDNVKDKNASDQGRLDQDLGIGSLQTMNESSKEQVTNFSYLLEHAEEDSNYVQLRRDYDRAVANYESFKGKKEKEIADNKGSIRWIENKKSDKYTEITEYYDANVGDFVTRSTITQAGYDRISQLKKNNQNARYQIDQRKKAYQKLDQESQDFLVYLKDSLNIQLATAREDQQLVSKRLNNQLMQKGDVMDSLMVINNAADRGIFGRIDIMHNYNQSTPTRKAAGWFLFLIFLIIETAPIIAKMASKVGPYDYALAALEYKTEKHEEQRKQLIDLTLQAQAEVARRALEVWKQEQIQMVEDDPYSFVKEIKKRSRVNRG